MVDNKTKELFDLNIHTARLLQSEPFFASLSRRVNKIKSDMVPTAGVRVNPDSERFELFYNPNFFESLTDVQRTDVLKHEFYHLIFEHVTSRKPEGINPKMWNFATDLAINSHLNDLPEGCLKPGITPFEDFPPGLSAEAYLKLLKKMAEEGKDKLSDESQFDSHDDWADGNDVESDQANEIARERLKDYLKKATNDAQTSSNGWGSVSSSVRKEILAKLKTSVDWKKVLRYFINTSTRAHSVSTVKRVNKRYRYIHAGKKVSRLARIAISIDQSGSISNQMLEAFFSELNKLAKLATFIVVPFDTRVDESLVYEWKKGQGHKTERVMQGGTCFNAPTEYANKKGFDGHIILTDLLAPKPKASKCQRMWMTTKQYATNPYFSTHERILVIDN
jgi:predicted metal-dependent peptidase